jgi:hypothetical protein
MKPGTPRLILLAVLGLCSLLPYLAARGLGDLRKNTVGFEVAFFGAFALYLIAVALVLRPNLQSSNSPTPNPQLWLIFAFAVLFRLTLLPMRPTLSDDMYRYVWDGRVQAHGFSPYRYPPNAKEVTDLHKGDRTIWPYINRKPVVTVYPPGAQLAYAGIWRVVGNNLTGFKAAFVLAELLGAALLLQMLRFFNLPLERILIYLWSPLLIFEVAHAGHVDGLMLPLLIAAFWARVKERHWLLGICLGAATLVKFFPALLLPALIPAGQVSNLPGRIRPALKMLTAFALTLALGYLPYLLWGGGVIGFLPQYFNENFNLGLARLLFDFAARHQLPGATLANAVTFGGLAVMGSVFLFRPAADGRAALLRCVWLIGWFTLFTQNLFPWYLLWLLPLVTLFVEPGHLLGLKLAPMSAWLIFSGTIALSYMFFIKWRVVPWAQAAEYWPLYALLLLSLAPYMRAVLAHRRVRLMPEPTPLSRYSPRSEAERGRGWG